MLLNLLMEYGCCYMWQYMVCPDDKPGPICRVYNLAFVRRVIQCYSDHTRSSNAHRCLLSARARQGFQYLHGMVKCGCHSWADFGRIHCRACSVAMGVLVDRGFAGYNNCFEYVPSQVTKMPYSYKRCILIVAPSQYFCSSKKRDLPGKAGLSIPLVRRGLSRIEWLLISWGRE